MSMAWCQYVADPGNRKGGCQIIKREHLRVTPTSGAVKLDPFSARGSPILDSILAVYTSIQQVQSWNQLK